MLSRRLLVLISASALVLGGCGSGDGGDETASSPQPTGPPAAVVPAPADTTGDSGGSSDDAASLSDNPANTPGAKKAIAYGLKITGSKDTACGDQATAGSTPADAANDPGCSFVAASFGCLAVLEPSADFAPDLVREQFVNAGAKILKVFDQALKDCAK